MRLRLALSILLTLCACTRTDTTPGSDTTTPAAPLPPAPESTVANADTATDIAERGRQVLAALKARDGARLAQLVHPTKGVRFSPYAYVQRDSDVVVARDSVARLFGDPTVRHWGYFDGSGDPLDRTFDQYYARFVYDVDFITAPDTRLNGPAIRPGNAPSNLREVYPDAQWIEYSFPGFDAKYGGMDWRSLWLVFERIDASWFLVGIVHGSWTS